MKIRVFTLRGGPPYYIPSPAEMQKLAEILENTSEVQLVYPFPSDSISESGPQPESIRSAESLVALLKPFCAFAEILTVERFSFGPIAHIHIWLESNIIHFTEAPWHPFNSPGSKEFLRLVEVVKCGRKFIASYIFSDHPDAHSTNKEKVANTLLSQLNYAGIEATLVKVVRQDWAFKDGDKCRWDIRIEPRMTEKPAVAHATKGNDTPYCDNCGHITLKKGSSFKCPNCGNEMRAI